MAAHHYITRQIGIDMGHRITFHGSKCRNLHGHRYEIFATCSGPLFETGEQAGMVLDFGFLKEEMMEEIDGPCDHGLCLWEKDPLTQELLNNMQGLQEAVEQGGGGTSRISPTCGRMYIVNFVPTAENLARHWFEVLAPRVRVRSEGQATLRKIVVYETPNCSAEYPA